WSKMAPGRFRPPDLLLLTARRGFAAVAPDPQRASTGGAPEAQKTRIVILGGGFGGVYTARHLEKLCKPRPAVETLLVSRHNLSPRHSAALRGVFGHPRSKALRVPRAGFPGTPPLRRGDCTEHRPGAPHCTRRLRRSKSHADLRSARSGARGPDQSEHDPGLGKRVHVQDARRR